LTLLRSKDWLDRAYSRALSYSLTYLLWVLGFRLLVLTLITYFLMSANSRFQDISDAYSSNEIMLVAVGAILYTALLKWLNPLTSTTTEEIFTPHRFEKRFLPGFAQGAVLACGVTLAFLLSGLYRYLGYFIQFEEAPLTLINILLRILGLGALAYCEEFVFRHKIMNYLRREMPDLGAAAFTALLYCGVKAFQFDLGWMQLVTLGLLSFSLSIKAMVDGDFVRGAGFWAGLLIVFHPFLSLPVLGNDFPGILLVKYQEGSEGSATAFRLLTGGIGGPLSSFALQLLLLLDVGQGLYKHKKILFTPKATRLK
jgi:hypothetical protein